jgi:uncharacterized protein (DUF488 family)
VAWRIYTIGHSTRSSGELVQLLEKYRVGLLADVRTAPGSRRMPHFNRDRLAPLLESRGIGYAHLKELGGLRRPRPGSANTGWRNEGFRGYADHLDSADFREGLHELERLADERSTAVMCAEAVPWRCHRSILADVLTVRGWDVVHIISDEELRSHELTRFAHVEGGNITYPAEQPALPFD